ncbi:hypothetical protein AVEN_201464-1 [Araneus ventricosus]|uniref:Histone-lysine N-methyltransferase SETMAR n=1 Tax=Araneus ventricosus TaxID=182803 RepID=A0A4Y2QBX3_ARAVE|nr:hypothetical protein AVEN_258458-1 [Araneus ventricosus]GBN60561.1 hypothetical protein AVEN_123882-1 [Araneus ventricosus]GBN61448.1 hypothetical protein AVEN_29928-1 [Araneus ventricosus]GBN61524.1 hypothetical protein AVEN_201464-1 [Araneus ventricosus]
MTLPVDTNSLASKRSANGEKRQPVKAVCLHVVVTGEMLLRQETFQVLEQMVVAGRLLHDNARPQAALLTPQLLKRFRWEVFNHPAYRPDLAPSDYHLFQHLKRFLTKQHFPSDDDVQTDSCRRLAGWLHSPELDLFDT